MITKFKIFEEIDLFADIKKMYPVGTKVVCIETSGASGLEEGNIYEIEEIGKSGSDSYKLKGIDCFYLASRFVEELEYATMKYNL
jgi:hypothetical protein